MKFTYYGHSCFSIMTGPKNILFDPFISGNELAKEIEIDTIPADYIFISHGHIDHMLDTERIAKRTGAIVVGVWEVYEYFKKKGLNVQPLNPGGKTGFEFGVVKAVSAQHSSSFPDGTYAGIASGFVVKTIEGNFYYSGDTSLTLDMTLIPKWANLDFAVFPIGDVLTMGIEDAIEAANFVKTNKVVGVHYKPFGIIKVDKPDAMRKFSDAGVQLYLPEIGNSIDI